jgi:hypothetical protein
LKMTRKLLNRYYRPAEDGGDLGGEGHAPSGGDAIGTGNDARIALLNSIGDSADEIRAEDFADINDDGSTSEFKIQRADGEQEDLTPEPETLPTEEPEPDATAQMITRKINGKMVTKSLEEWLVSASKVEAADEYLQDAARTRKESMQEPATPAPQPEPRRPDPQVVAAQQRAERVKLARAIQMGTEDEAVAALEQLQNMARTPTLTVEDVGRVTDERLKFNTAITNFNKEFADLVSNPELHRMVLQADAELIRNGDKRPYAERYTEVGKAVRGWRDDLIKSVAPAPTAEQPAPASLDQRRAAKAAAPKTPTAASKIAQTPVDDDQDEDVGSVIASMAKARGGPQWARG